ncbi:hypothetical protein BT67DRAFT_139453 [Trichocladium antarcticum]|uniref:Uncharacterized protein n=1 Tax=Trichocladium antarcticum TaxID=1450529 RepID=A0AAN6UFI0_9PEZI|nr:hypothetical protein BT67DRAFT_139453 [Trichocladium antarcticum]
MFRGMRRSWRACRLRPAHLNCFFWRNPYLPRPDFAAISGGFTIITIAASSALLQPTCNRGRQPLAGSQ